MKLWVSLAIPLLFLGCGGTDSVPADAEETPLALPAEPSEQDRSPRLLSVPGDDSAPQPTAPAADGPGLHWTAPAHWIEEPPANSMRAAQYRLPGFETSDMPATFVVFYFGPGQGGPPEANIERWAGQFAQPDGSDPVAALKLERAEQGTYAIWRAEIVGIYDGGMAMMGGEAQRLDDWMLLAAIVETASGPVFFKGTGPRETMESERAAFEALLQSLDS